MTETSGTVRALSMSLVILSAGCVPDETEAAPVPAGAVAQVDADDSAFTYSIIDLTSDRAAVIALLEARVMPTVMEAGAKPYSVWLPLEVTEEALRRALSSAGGARTPFTPLGEAQLGLMLAWSGQGVQVEVLDSALMDLDGVEAVTTRTFDPIYLAAGLRVPTGPGFYIHRESRNRAEDVADVVRLSEEAWETFELTFGARVTGLFRERTDSDDVARLLRIVWYRSLEGWLESRGNRDPESRQRFMERNRMRLEGSGVAIATDRAAQ